jgi:hypothetical protein
MTDPKKPGASRRSPDGVLTAKPIALRLMPDERASLEKASRTEGRSMAAQARMFFLQGLADYQCNQTR